MLARVSASAAAVAVLVLGCTLSCAGDPSRSRIHFGGPSTARTFWSPFSRSSSSRSSSSRPSAPAVSPARRHRARLHASSRRQLAPPPCDRACQIERSKAKSPCAQRARDGGWRCGEQLVRYSYVAASDSCVPFLFGGCRGTANNFLSFEQCRDECRGGGGGGLTRGFRPSVRQTGNDRPGQLGNRFGGGRPRPPQKQVIGPRQRPRPSPPISFPGPVATPSPSRSPPKRPRRIKTRRACLRPPRDAGKPCGEPAIVYSYLQATNSCVPFEFGGCGGTSNRFTTFIACRDLCKAPPRFGVGPRRRTRPPRRDTRPRVSRRCQLPWVAGPCRGNGPIMRYYYNDRKATCDLALYSGCGGNANRFNSRYMCERSCRLGSAKVRRVDKAAEVRGGEKSEEDGGENEKRSDEAR